MTRCTFLLLGTFLLVGACRIDPSQANASEAVPDWNAVAAVDTVQVSTKNPDGTSKNTTVWLVVVDGKGYLRTGNTRWWSNIERDPSVVVRIEGKEYLLHVALVADPGVRQRVQDAFRAKYTWSDRVVGFFFSSEPHILSLLPRGDQGSRLPAGLNLGKVRRCCDLDEG